MLYWKAWCEVRKRFYVGLVFTFAFVGFIFYLANQADLSKAPSPALLKEMSAAGFAASQRGAFLWYESYTAMVAMIGAWLGVMLAGAGLNTQTTYGMSSGPHPSMLFTLSLPVYRRELVLSRSLLGAALSVVLTFVPALLFPLLTMWFSPQPMSFLSACAYSGMAAIGSMVFYWIGVLCATTLDEQWQLYATWIAVSIVAALGRLAQVPVLSKLVDLGLSVSLVRDHTVPWPTIAACFCISVAMLVLSIRVTEQRQY